MDEVAENSDALMERYLEGEEISHDEIVGALKDGTNHGHLFPVTCGVATRNLGVNRLLDAIVEDLPVAGQARRPRAARDHARARRGRRRSTPTCSRPAPTRSPGASISSASTRARWPTTAGAQHARPRQGAHRPAGDLRGARDRRTPRSSGRATSARWPSSRRPARATGWPTATSRSRCRRSSSRPRSWPSPSSRRSRAGRTRSSPRCAACRRRTRRSTCTATRRRARRSSPGSPRSTSRSRSSA